MLKVLSVICRLLIVLSFLLFFCMDSLSIGSIIPAIVAIALVIFALWQVDKKITSLSRK